MLKDLIVFQKAYDLLEANESRDKGAALALLGGLRKRFGGAAPDMAASPKG